MENPLITSNTLINGYRIAYGVHGEGKPLVLLHGTPSSSYIWRNIVPALAAAGYRAHVFDLLGYGLSERPCDPQADTSVTGQVDILRGLMAHWQLDSAHIIAHDIGGGTALRLGVFHPQLISSLTLIDIVSFDSWPSARTRQQMQEGLETLIAAPPARHRAHFEEWLLSTVQNKAGLRESGALAYYLHLITGTVGQASFFQHQVSHYDHKHTSEISDRLPALAAKPVNIIWGADDAWQVKAWAQRLHETIDGSQLTLLADCGHFAMEDQPQQVADTLLRFLTAIAATK